MNVQMLLINKLVNSYADGSEAEQHGWYNVIMAYARKRGFSKDNHAEILARYDAAEQLYFVCRESGNLELLDTAREMMTVYYAVQQAMEGFSSAPENLLWARVAALA